MRHGVSTALVEISEIAVSSEVVPSNPGKLPGHSDASTEETTTLWRALQPIKIPLEVAVSALIFTCQPS